jgi:hypothetical protein
VPVALSATSCRGWPAGSAHRVGDPPIREVNAREAGPRRRQEARAGPRGPPTRSKGRIDRPSTDLRGQRRRRPLRRRGHSQLAQAEIPPDSARPAPRSCARRNGLAARGSQPSRRRCPTTPGLPPLPRSAPGAGDIAATPGADPPLAATAHCEGCPYLLQAAWPTDQPAHKRCPIAELPTASKQRAVAALGRLSDDRSCLKVLTQFCQPTPTNAAKPPREGATAVTTATLASCPP